MRMDSIKFHYHKSLRDCNNPNSKWSFWFVFLNQEIFNLYIFCVNLRIHTYSFFLLLHFLFCIIFSEKIQNKHIYFFQKSDVLFNMEYRVKVMTVKLHWYQSSIEFGLCLHNRLFCYDIS